MTPDGHVKVLGILHLVCAFVTGGAWWFMSSLLYRLMGGDGGRPGVAPENTILLMVLGLVYALVILLFCLPQLIAGLALLSRKSWARTAAIVSSFFSLLNLPLGTALAFYTFWFFFNDGKDYKKSLAGTGGMGALGEGSPGAWDAGNKGRAREEAYVPPVQPPDWR